MSSAITSSSESFIRSLGRCAPPPPCSPPHIALHLALQTCAGQSTCQGNPVFQEQGAAWVFSGIEWGWGRAAQELQLHDLGPHVVLRPLRKSSSVPMRKALPSWSSSNFWARRSNCRISRGEFKGGTRRVDLTHVPGQGGSPGLAPWRPGWGWRLRRGLGTPGQVPRRPGCDPRADGDRVCVLQLPQQGDHVSCVHQAALHRRGRPAGSLGAHPPTCFPLSTYALSHRAQCWALGPDRETS
jgi:hypothetical protein